MQHTVTYRSKLFAIVLAIVVALSFTVMTDQTFAAAKPAQVKGLKVVSKSASTKSASVKIAWKKASRAKKYNVKYRLAGTKTWKSIKTTSKSATLKSLKGSKKYYVKVRGMNGKRYGKYSKTITFKTKALQKAKPVKPAATLNISQSSATLYLGDQNKAKEQYTLQLTASGTATGLEWGTDDAKVATVDQNGVVTPVGVGQTKISVCAEGICKVCDVTVVAAKYNYITPENMFKSMATNDSEYVLVDVRQYVNKSATDMGSYTEAHIAGAITAPIMTEEYEAMTDADAIKNLEAAGVKVNSGKKFIFICYYGGEIAERAATLARSVMGVSNDDILLLEGGQWSVDPNWSFMCDNPYDAPQYLIKIGKLSDGVDAQMVTKEQMAEAFDKNTAYKLYTYLDVRAGSSCDVCSEKIPNAIPASVDDNDGAALKKAVDAAGPTALFVLCDDDGGDVVTRAYHKLISYGIPAHRIIVQEGGLYAPENN